MQVRVSKTQHKMQCDVTMSTSSVISHPKGLCFFFHLLCIAQAVSPEPDTYLTSSAQDTVLTAVQSLLWNSFLRFHRTLQPPHIPLPAELQSPPPLPAPQPQVDVLIQIATSFIFALFLEQINRINLSFLPRTARSMGTTYRFSF